MVARTGAERLRRITADDWPDADERDEARAWVEEMAAHAEWPPPDPAPSYPPLAEQLGNALAAAGRFAASGFARVGRAEFQRRRAICMGCPSLDRAANRCKECGCVMALKPWSKAERCPLGKWEAPDHAG